MSACRWIPGVVASALLAGCVSSRTVPCGDDLVCADGTTCVAIPQFDLQTCATREQLASCAGAMDGDACTLDGLPGTCFSQSCQPAVCGDGIRDTTEACDDKNRVGGDGCSANCLSTEVCGDGLIDLALGEQCDDGMRGLSGDACSSTCKSELAVWRDISPGQPAGRSLFGLATGLDGGIVLFGGTSTAGTTGDNTSARADLWSYDGAGWAQQVQQGPTPPPRFNFSLTRDPKRNTLLLFGGVLTSDGQTHLADLWEWDGLRWYERTPATSPSPRRDAGFACTMTRCVLFGGRTSSPTTAEQNDAWEWNGTTWTKLMLGGPPSARSGAAWIADPERDVFELAGGLGASSQYLTDGWELRANGWIQVANANTFPAAPILGAYDSGSHRPIVVVLDRTMAYNGLWSQIGLLPAGISQIAYHPLVQRIVAIASSGLLPYSFDGTSWTARPLLVPNQGASGGANRTAAAYDVGRARTVVLDYSSGTGATAATWEWDGASWHRTLTSGPLAADGIGLAYDRTCKTTVAVGGRGGVFLPDTWVHDGTAWTSRAGMPAGRAFHAIAFDQERAALVVFGGRTAAGVDAATYVWSGACNARAWANAAPATSPPARTNTAMAYDESAKVTILFGGNDGNVDLSDTWEWNGTTWTERTPMASPAARSDHVMTYDPRRRRVVVFGGRSGTARYSDTWEWDAAAGTWREVPAIVHPSARSGGALAPDVTGGLIAIGGGAPTALTDVYRLRYEGGLAPVETCMLATDDLDGDGLAGCEDPDCWTRCSPTCPPGTSCSAARCGDGECKAPEDYLLCPTDCPPPS